jgi:hypothetical protein
MRHSCDVIKSVAIRAAILDSTMTQIVYEHDVGAKGVLSIAVDYNGKWVAIAYKDGTNVAYYNVPFIINWKDEQVPKS